MLHILKNSNLMLKASAVLSVVFMTSCGSYSNVSSYTDGIYGDEVVETRSQQTERTPQRSSTATAQEDNSEYVKYFKEQGEMINEARGNNEVFTDVDNYSSTNTPQNQDDFYYEDENYNTSYNTSNPSWGTNPTSVSINYYNNPNPWFYGGGWNAWGWRAGVYNPYWGFNSWNGGFIDPWNPYFNGFYGPGFAYGAGWYGGFYGGIYGGGFYNPWFRRNPYYGYAYRNHYRNQATPYGLRSSRYAARGNNRSSVRSSSGRSNLSRNRALNLSRVNALRNSNSSARSSSGVRVRNPRNVSARRSSSTLSNNRTSTYRNTSTRRSGVRSTTTSRRSTTTTRSSSPSRSSSTRSSGRSSSSRSSGRSSSSRRGGR